MENLLVFPQIRLRLTAKICQFLRLTAKFFGRFTANGYPHRDPLASSL